MTRNCRLLSLTSVSGKITFLGIHLQACEGQDGSWKYLLLVNKKLCLAIVITFYDDMTVNVAKGRISQYSLT